MKGTGVHQDFFSSRGTRYHYVSNNWATTKQRWVFLHGFLGSSQDWFPFLQHLPADIGWTAVDLLGHGKSELSTNPLDYHPTALYQDIRELWDHLGANDSDIAVGYSMGGRQLLGAVLDRALKPGILILISASFGIPDSSTKQQRRQQDQERASNIRPDTFLQFLDNWYHQPMLTQQVPADAQARQVWYKLRSSNHPQAIAACLEGFSPGIAPDFSCHAKHLSCPTLLISGTNDPAYDNHYKQIVESLPDGCHISILGCAHSPQLENPFTTTQQCLSFLKSRLS
jgi:2-succinyl-6-hydroxy-2,4-cyclohexadiene-1-carboxylate synthase